MYSMFSGHRKGIQRVRTQEGFDALLLHEDGSKECKACGQPLSSEHIPDKKDGHRHTTTKY